MRNALFYGLVLVVGGCGSAPRGVVLDDFRARAPGNVVASPVRLASSTSNEFFGRLSPDGRELLYVNDQKGEPDIWIRDLTTGLPRRVVVHPSIDTQPNWSADGKKFVFVSMRFDAKGDIFLWEDDDLKRLTDESQSDEFPEFSPDNSFVVFASGSELRTRIEKVNIKSKERTVLSDWGATHPTMSRDGQWMAYTFFPDSSVERAAGKHRSGQIILRRLRDNHEIVVSDGAYPAGFPAFSPNGERLYFVRFYRGPPLTPREENASASLWAVNMADFISESVANSARQLRQITSDESAIYFPQVHAQGVVLTEQHLSNLDVVTVPDDGVVPHTGSAASQFALARQQSEPWLRILALSRVADYPDARENNLAAYEQAHVLIELGEREKARSRFEEIIESSLRDDSDTRTRAHIDLIYLNAQQATETQSGGGIAADRKQLNEIIQGLNPDTETSAYALLIRGRLEQLLGESDRALATWKSILQRQTVRSRIVIDAKLAIGELLSFARQPELMVGYYVSLIHDVSTLPSDQRDLVEKIAQRVFSMLEPSPVDVQVIALRRLIDRSLTQYPDHWVLRRFAAQAQRRIGQLQEQQKEVELAIDAMDEAMTISSTQPEVRDVATAAAFDLARLSLIHTNALRELGRSKEAYRWYQQSLDAYEKILGWYQPKDEPYLQARREYRRLALEDAAQLVNRGKNDQARRRYERIIAIDDRTFEAHRGLIRLAANPQEYDAIVSEFEERLDKQAEDPVAHYGIAYAQLSGREIDDGVLDDANDHLNQAISFAPEEPLLYLARGWVSEMRERYLDETGKGWLEEAIADYERAYALNDRTQSIQVEGDLLLNLVNMFSDLGNSSTDVDQYCKQRKKLNLPFTSKLQEAYHLYTCGRASLALGNYSSARRSLEQALELAREEGHANLEAEIIARLALNAVGEEDFDTAQRYFTEVKEKFTVEGQTRRLAAIERNMVWVALRQQDYRGALTHLEQARAYLAEHGVPEIEPYQPIALDPEATTSPFGFTPEGERLVQDALAEDLAQTAYNWGTSQQKLEEMKDTQSERVSERDEYAPLQEEQLHLANRGAVAALMLGEQSRFNAEYERAWDIAQKLHVGRDGGFQPNPTIFAIQTGMLINQIAGNAHLDDAWTRKLPAVADTIRDRLNWLRVTEEQWVEVDKKRLWSQRLKVANWNALAAMLVARPDVPFDTPGAAPGKDRSAQLKNNFLAQRQKTFAYGEALRLYRAIRRELLTVDDGSEQNDTPDVKSILDDLRRPLNVQERAQASARALLNESLLLTLFIGDAQELAEHRSTLQLENELNDGRAELGALRPLIAAEIAWRRRDVPAMDKAVADLLSYYPWYASPRDLEQSEIFADEVFSRGIRLAFQLKDWERALAYAEDKDRLKFAVALIQDRPRADDAHRNLLQSALDAQHVYAETLNQDDAKARLAARETLTVAINELTAKAPRVAELFMLQHFSLETFKANLGSGQIAVTAIANGNDVVLMRIDTSGIQAKRVELANTAAIQQAVDALVRDAALVFLDVGRLPAANSSATKLGSEVPRVQLAGLWQLIDARAQRNAFVPSEAIWSESDGAWHEAAENMQWTWVPAEKGRFSAPNADLEKASIIIFGVPIAAEGGLATNMRFQLPRQVIERNNLDDVLGIPWRARLAIVPRGAGIPGQQRKEAIALARLLHSSGVASYITWDDQAPLSAEKIKSIVTQIDQISLATLAQQQHVQLHGDAGVAPDQKTKYVEDTLKKTIAEGAAAFKNKNYAQSINALESATRYMEQSGDSKFLGGALLYLANAYGLSEDYQRGTRVLLKLLALRRETLKAAPADQQAKAQQDVVDALYSLAWMHFRAKEYSLALQTNSEALDMLIKSGKRLPALSHYRQRTQLAEESGDYAEALAAAREAVAIAKEDKSTPGAITQRVETQIALARILRQRFSRFREALGVIKQASADAEQQADAASLAVEALLERGRAQGATGNYFGAVQSVRRALAIADQNKLPNDAVKLELANNLYYLGNYDEVFNVTKEALTNVALGADRQVQFMNAQGSALAALGRNADSIKVLRGALERAKRMNRPGEIAATYNNVGNTLRLAGKFESAKEQFTRAFSIDRKQADKLGMAFSLANRGLAELGLSQLSQANQDLQAALTLGNEIGAATTQLKALDGLARLRIQQQKFTEAQTFARQGEAIARKQGLRSWYWRFLLLQGQALRGTRGKEAQAQRVLDAALNVVMTLPIQPRRPPGQPDVDPQPEDVFDELIPNLVAQGKREEALLALHAYQARSLVDMSGNSLLQLKDGALGPALENVQAAQHALEAAHANQLQESDTPQDAAAAKALVDEAETNLTTRLRDLGALQPGLISFVHPEAPSSEALSAARQNLADRTLVAYYPAVSELLIFVATADQIQVQSVPVSRQELENQIARWRKQLKSYHSVRESSEVLYGWLFKPIEPLIKSTRVTVVPTKLLYALPWEALHDGKDDLVARFAFDYARALENTAAVTPIVGKGLAAVSFSGSDDANPLPFAEKESETFARTLPNVTRFSGDQSTREKFLNTMSRSRVVHLATHAQFNVDDPLTTTIVFADGPLELRELLPLKTNRPLVVLAACDSGMAPLDGAEGVLSIESAFKAIGAQQVVASRWRVSDLGSALVMKHFFRGLEKRKNPVDALHEAQLQVRAQLPHPIFWAAFGVDAAQASQ